MKFRTLIALLSVLPCAVAVASQDRKTIEPIVLIDFDLICLVGVAFCQRFRFRVSPDKSQKPSISGPFEFSDPARHVGQRNGVIAMKRHHPYLLAWSCFAWCKRFGIASTGQPFFVAIRVGKREMETFSPAKQIFSARQEGEELAVGRPCWRGR